MLKNRIIPIICILIMILLSNDCFQPLFYRIKSIPFNKHNYQYKRYVVFCEVHRNNINLNDTKKKTITVLQNKLNKTY